MTYKPPHGLPLIEEDEATAEVAAIYDEHKRDTQSPLVPNMMKAMAVSPDALKIHTAWMNTFFSTTNLPLSLVAMICYTIAEKSHCEYCAAANELTCRTLGVDEATLTALAHDLGEVNPERIRAIIQFSLKAAKYPQSLEPQDYDKVREHGISNAEIVEIVQVAGFMVYLDILADALKIPVEEEIVQALPHRY